jgi:hypothetical protein
MAHRRPLAGAGLGVACLGLATIALKARRKGVRRAGRTVAVSANGHGQHSNGHAHNGANGGNGSSHLPGLAVTKLALANGERGRNGQSFKHDGRRRKKHFRYHAFYSEMVMKLSSSNYGVSKAGSLAMDLSEGSGGMMMPASSSMATVIHGRGPEQEALARETAKLIDGQQKLIEGYRKLIEEQQKLMEEKSKLIAVESHVLEKQAQFMEEQQLL